MASPPTMLPVEGDVVVIGGGLAGLSAAWYLRAAGREVLVLEKADRLGGKAGSEDVKGDGDEVLYRSDHGYHLFPEWYDNVKDLMGAIGLDYDAITVPGERFISSFGTTHDVTVLDESEAPTEERGELWLSFLASILQLITADDAELRNRSVKGFLAAKNSSEAFVDSAVIRHQSLLLKALANHADRMSALSVARMYRRWVSPLSNVIKPSWSALHGSLQTCFIDPLERALREVGVDIQTGVAVTGVEADDDGITAVRLSREVNGRSRIETEGPVVLAVPPDALKHILGDDPPEILADLVAVAQLRMAVMSAIDVHYENRVTTPGDHFSFKGSEQSLTGYDISRNWIAEELPASVKDGERVVRTVLQVIATEPRDLMKLREPERQLKQRVLGEIRRSPDHRHIDDEASVMHVNLDAPLFMNDVGVDDKRPPVNHARARNLFLAGDYCESSIDVASMEAAVATGRIAAQSIVSPEPVTLDTPVGPAVRIIAKAARMIPMSWGAIQSAFALKRRMWRKSP